MGSSALLITRPDGDKEYKVVDHLGSARAIVDGSGSVAGRYDNGPFGKQIAVTGVESRKQYIDKEKDRETGTANHGVRQYEYEGGRFVSIDPLWEEFPAQNPYQYSFNNPVVLVDMDGDKPYGA